MGRTSVGERRGATEAELRKTRTDIWYGMVFSNIVMYFIILSTGTTLYRAEHTDLKTAADAARALDPLAGRMASLLFASGVVAVGFLAVPIMTGGAAYDLSQTVGWRSSLHAAPGKARNFYLSIIVFTAAAAAMNFIGLNPMKVLVWSGVVQGFSTPPLMLLIMLMTNNRRIMGDRVNGRAINILGAVTTLIIFAASVALVVSAVMR
jgi:Mn2+/Fe2+ NRAMP family transporter